MGDKGGVNRAKMTLKTAKSGPAVAGAGLWSAVEGEHAAPLAARLRPGTLEAVVGQEAAVALLQRIVAGGQLQSLIFWGPPGVGKTTLARLYAQGLEAEFVELSAVLAGVADVRQVVAEALAARATGRRTVLFVDEIHRFNKAQQDAFLPQVEQGVLTLVGATTENPSFALNNALLSRCTVVPLVALTEAELAQVLGHAEALVGPLPLQPDARAHLLAMAHGDARALLNVVALVALTEAELAQVLGHAEALVGPLPLQPDARAHLLAMAHGDARALLNVVALVASARLEVPLDAKGLAALVPARAALYDRAGDWHYDLISALHKAVRASDPDAALYYLARMLAGGEDGVYLARRLIRMAVEDVGLADPTALPLAVAAREAYATMGSPEGDLALAEVAVFLAMAPKSNATYVAWKAAQQLAARTAAVPPPKALVNAPTSLMKTLGHGAGYVYDHDTASGVSGQHCWPEGVAGEAFYRPVARGCEREMQKRMAYFIKLRQSAADEHDEPTA
jgi:putative ATPase